MATKTATKENKVKRAQSHVRYVRISARKMRLVADLVRGSWAIDAITQLQFTNKKAAGLILDAIKSAMANGANNHKMKKENMFVASITVDEGPKLKRWMPRAQGRATPKRRPMSHLNVVLEERANAPKRFSKFKVTEKVKEEKPEVNEEVKGKSEPKTPEMQNQIDKPESKVKENKVQNKRRLFNRKSGV